MTERDLINHLFENVLVETIQRVLLFWTSIKEATNNRMSVPSVSCNDDNLLLSWDTPRHYLDAEFAQESPQMIEIFYKNKVTQHLFTYNYFPNDPLPQGILALMGLFYDSQRRCEMSSVAEELIWMSRLHKQLRDGIKLKDPKPETKAVLVHSCILRRVERAISDCMEELEHALHDEEEDRCSEEV